MKESKKSLKKDCTTCKWQPEWGTVYGGNFARQNGDYRHPLASQERILRQVPGCMIVTSRAPIKYVGSDEIENVRTPCPKWEAAEEGDNK